MRREKENMNKREERIRTVQSLRKASDRGITLIALVITILIIIILATVTINFAFGDNGLINMAEETRDLAANSTDYESDARANLVAFMNEFIAGETGGSSGGNETEEPTPEPEPEPEPEPDPEPEEPPKIQIVFISRTQDSITLSIGVWNVEGAEFTFEYKESDSDVWTAVADSPFDNWNSDDWNASGSTGVIEIPYRLEGLLAGTTYDIRITATTDAGEGVGTITVRTSGAPTPAVPVTGISINPTSLEYVYGDVINVPEVLASIEVTIEPSNATNKNYKWESVGTRPLDLEDTSYIFYADDIRQDIRLRVTSEDNSEVYADLTILVDKARINSSIIIFYKYVYQITNT